jgi:hypothetical protein
MAISLIIAVAKPKGKTISKATAAGKIKDKALPEDWTGLKWQIGG